MTRTSFLCFMLLVGAGAALAAFMCRQQGDALDPVSGFPREDADEIHDALQPDGPWVIR